MSEILSQHVLVLNRSWLAVNFCTVKRALSLLFLGVAQVVTEDYETHDFESWADLSRFARKRLIHTPRFVLRAPDIILLRSYNRFPPYFVRFNRRNIFLRDNFSCQYCGRRPPKDELTIDHVTPRSRGGTTCWENVVLACMECNKEKGDSLFGERGMHLIRKPKKPHWLICVQNSLEETNRSVWQKFIDMAYWESTLKE